MTTESMTRDSVRVHSPGLSPLVGAAVAGLLLVVVVVLAGGLTSGGDAAVGAAVGGGLAVLVFGTGLAVVNLVARLMPAASLLVALLTYVLQVVVMAVVALALVRAEVATGPDARGWFAGSIIAVTTAWLGVQVWLVGRQRIPAYDLPVRQQPGGER